MAILTIAAMRYNMPLIESEMRTSIGNANVILGNVFFFYYVNIQGSNDRGELCGVSFLRIRKVYQLVE